MGDRNNEEEIREEGFSELGRPTLEERNERGDLIQAYKVLTGKEVRTTTPGSAYEGTGMRGGD